MKYLVNFIKILRYIWELPQNILGLYIRRGYVLKEVYNIDGMETEVYYSKYSPSGISLGKYIVLNPLNIACSDRYKERIIRHEHGHQIQSMIWGPLYLLTVGVPSVIRYTLAGKGLLKISYFNAYPENQADMFGGVCNYND